LQNEEKTQKQKVFFELLIRLLSENLMYFDIHIMSSLRYFIVSLFGFRKQIFSDDDSHRINCGAVAAVLLDERWSFVIAVEGF
jgi:hypothetical protein